MHDDYTQPPLAVYPDHTVTQNRRGEIVERVTVYCAACGKPMRRRMSDLARGKTDRVFCSRACWRTVPAKPRRGTERTCETCGDFFYASAGNDKRFCSVACQNVWQGRNRVTRICEICGAEFTLSPSQAKLGPGRFCSLDCKGIASRKHAMDRLHNGRPALHTPGGYVKVWEPEHPKATSGYVLEHRIIMERILGRYLETDEEVHHKNRIRDDNSEDNLEVMNLCDHRSMSSNDRHAREKAEREAIQRELDEYRKRYGPLNPS